MARMVMCKKLHRELPGLDRPPIPGELGKRIYEGISAEAWEMWQEQSRLLINHYGLNLADPDARQLMRKQMEEFLFGDEEEREAGGLDSRGAERREGQGRANGASAQEMSDLHSPGAILLVTCYELGHQPLNLASPLAMLRQAGYDPAAIDTSVSALPDEALTHARVLAISVPMHTALRLGVRVAERARRLNPDITICFYGLYATLNAEYLLREHADALIGGEYEEALLALVQAVEQGAPLSRGSGRHDARRNRRSSAAPPPADSTRARHAASAGTLCATGDGR